MKLLLVEDDVAMRTTLARTLTRRGFAVTACGDGPAAWAHWQQGAPQLVLLDLTLPGMDGLDVLQQARTQGLRTPVLILTARGTVGDRVLGLNAGADDYLPKPFDLDELEARLRALLRRQAAAASPGAESETQRVVSAQQMGAFSYDNDSGAVYCRGQVLDLPPRELALLRTLLQKAGQAVSKEKLFHEVFPGANDFAYEAIEVVAYRLRRKLAGLPAELVTLRGLGYLLRLTA